MIMISINNKCVNIGCGNDIRIGWDNADISPLNDSVISFDISKHEDLMWLSNQSYDIIECNHVIGYLNYVCVVDFFKSCLHALNRDGRLILEFPDVIKISKKVVEISSCDLDEYIEVIRAFYAFDPKDAMNYSFNKKTYIFGWSEPIVVRALNEAGFGTIKTVNPKTHGRVLWRDSRIEAMK